MLFPQLVAQRRGAGPIAVIAEELHAHSLHHDLRGARPTTAIFAAPSTLWAWLDSYEFADVDAFEVLDWANW
ncbi:hypothetical protein ABN034_33635 [Actinopolymorpha sp. B11F2]|uniref:hypothetical protein n=1 Tax=Actinopolymorpha sp. B11F2 TaxID=3160862 RepID=UPI0032E3E10B